MRRTHTTPEVAARLQRVNDFLDELRMREYRVMSRDSANHGGMLYRIATPNARGLLLDVGATGLWDVYGQLTRTRVPTVVEVVAAIHAYGTALQEDCGSFTTDADAFGLDDAHIMASIRNVLRAKGIEPEHVGQQFRISITRVSA